MQADNNISQYFTCIVCMETMLPPIHMCVVGHSFCNECTSKMEHCPICRAPLGTTRNFALEGLLGQFEFPCEYHHEGCDFKGDAFALKEHMKQEKLQCPLKQPCNCSWSGPYENILAHCKQEHPENTYDTNTLWLKGLRSAEETCHHMMVTAYGKLFQIRWIVGSAGPTSMVVYFWGDVAEREQFHFKLRDIKDSKSEVRAICVLYCANNSNTTKNL